MTEPETTEEIWLFTGSRRGRSGKRIHGWLPQPDNDLDHELYFSAKGHRAVGSEYTVQVRRHPDGAVTMYGSPVYHGRHDNDTLRARVEARHRAAETELRREQLERSDKRASALNEALEPLVTLSEELRATERDAFLAFVIRRITRPWAGSS